MSFYDDVYKEAMHDYDPEPEDRPTPAELAEDEEERKRKPFCPRCGPWCRYPKHEDADER